MQLGDRLVENISLYNYNEFNLYSIAVSSAACESNPVSTVEAYSISCFIGPDEKEETRSPYKIAKHKSGNTG